MPFLLILETQNVAVDAIGPETDFTLETNRKSEQKTTKDYSNYSVLKYVFGFQNHTETLQHK